MQQLHRQDRVGGWLVIDFCYTWIPSLAHVHPNSILLDLAKHGFSIIWRSSKNMNFPKIWRLWLKNCARHAHFNFELLKGVAVLFFEVYPWNFDQLWIFYRQKKWCFIDFSVSSTEKLKFEKNPFLFSGVAPKWYIIVHNHDFLYHLGAILKKKKKLLSNFSFHVEDTEKWLKHHFFVYKKSISDQNFKGIAQKIGLPCPWEVQNWNERGGRNFWATTSKFWENSYFLKIFKW